ncbi:hypothetical protein TKK_0017439 [Trichogramma kaykai]
MSCSVKQITSAAAKSWSCSNGSANPSQSTSQGGNGGSSSTQQTPNRRINSLAEEVVVTIPGNGGSNASPQQQQPQQLIVAASAAAAAAVANNAATQSQIQQRTNRLALAKKGEDTAKLLRYIDDNVVGKNGTFLGPFGRRKGKRFAHSLLYTLTFVRCRVPLLRPMLQVIIDRSMSPRRR